MGVDGGTPKVDDYLTPKNWFVLLLGLSMGSEPLTFALALALRRLEAATSVFDLAAAGAAGFHEWATLEPFISACACEIQSNNEAAHAPGYDTLNPAWLASVLLMLLGHGTLRGVPTAGAHRWLGSESRLSQSSRVVEGCSSFEPRRPHRGSK